MLKRFFLSRQGAQVGPFTVNEILEKLQRNEHAWNDYIYDESREDWMLLLEHPLFADKYSQGWARMENMHPTSVHPFHEKKWAIQKDEKQFGPFSYLEVIQMLQERTLQETDHISLAKVGRWQPVKDFEEFSTQKIRHLMSTADRHIKEVFNRRRYPRAQFEGTLIVHDNKTVFRGQTFQISAGGAGLYIPSSALQPGQTLLLHFHPSMEVPAFNAVAAVVSKVLPNHEAEVQLKPLRYGVKFTSISQNVKEKIYSYTNKKKAVA
jgi:hypothetical protein